MELLPVELLVEVFRLLPLDTRLRCREVSKAFRDALEDRTLWASLSLSGVSAPLNRVRARGALKAAVMMAGGYCLNAAPATVSSLDLTGCEELLSSDLLPIVANLLSLEELRGLEGLRISEFERNALRDLHSSGRQLRRISLQAMAQPGSLTARSLMVVSSARLMLRGETEEPGPVQLAPETPPLRRSTAGGGERPVRRRSGRLADRRAILSDKRILMLATLEWYLPQMLLSVLPRPRT